MEDLNFRKGDAKTEVFGSNRMLQPSPVEKIPDGPTTPEIAYQMVKGETFAQTQPRLNLATFVTTLYGRICHQADERSHQHQLHRRDRNIRASP